MARDWEGLEDWYQATHPRVLGVLAGVCGSVDAAAEATYEAFARALTRWDRVQGLSPAEGCHPAFGDARFALDSEFAGRWQGSSVREAACGVGVSQRPLEPPRESHSIGVTPRRRRP